EASLDYGMLTGSMNQVKQGDTISIKAYENKADLLGQKVSLTVLAWSGEKANIFTRYAYHKEQISELKIRIATTINTPPSYFDLWKRNIQMEEDKTVGDYGLGSGSRIH